MTRDLPLALKDIEEATNDLAAAIESLNKAFIKVKSILESDEGKAVFNELQSALDDSEQAVSKIKDALKEIW